MLFLFGPFNPTIRFTRYLHYDSVSNVLKHIYVHSKYTTGIINRIRFDVFPILLLAFAEVSDDIHHNVTMLKAVILVGGPQKGTRFRPLSFDLPKPLFPVAGYPLLQHLIEACAAVEGIERTHLNLHMFRITHEREENEKNIDIIHISDRIIISSFVFVWLMYVY